MTIGTIIHIKLHIYIGNEITADIAFRPICHFAWEDQGELQGNIYIY